MTREQQIEQAFQDMRAEVLMKTFFPDNEEGYLELIERLKRCMPFVSVKNLGCVWQTYEAMIKCERRFTMTEMNLVFEVVKAATPKELEETPEQNLEFLTRVIVPLETKWFEFYEKIIEPIQAKLKAQYKILKNTPPEKTLILPS